MKYIIFGILLVVSITTYGQTKVTVDSAGSPFKHVTHPLASGKNWNSSKLKDTTNHSDGEFGEGTTTSKMSPSDIQKDSIAKPKSQFQKDKDSAVKYYRLRRLALENGTKVNQAGIHTFDPKYNFYNTQFFLYRNRCLGLLYKHNDSVRFLNSFGDSLDTYKHNHPKKPK